MQEKNANEIYNLGYIIRLYGFWVQDSGFRVRGSGFFQRGGDPHLGLIVRAQYLADVNPQPDSEVIIIVNITIR